VLFLVTTSISCQIPVGEIIDS